MKLKIFSIVWLIIVTSQNSFAQNSLIQARIKCEHGNITMDAGYYSDALKIFEDCLQKYDSLPEAIYGAARAAYYTGDYKSAKKYVTDVLNTNNSEFKLQADYQNAFRLAALIEVAEKSSIATVFVKGGSYTAGCVDGRDVQCEEEEKPSYPVVVGDFFIAKYEVTQSLWTKIMGNNPSGFAGCNECPVENVSWDSVQVFIQKLNRLYPGMNFRLPTEAEWEYAARGGNKSKGYKYCGSNNPYEVAWFDSNSAMTTHPVGTKAPNELGLYDMGGNIW